MEFKSREKTIMEYLKKFYRKHNTVIEEKIIPIVEGRSEISLRLIENFITKYCQKNKVIIQKKNKSYIFVYEDYKDQLKSYDKQHFDPFKRRHHILFKYNKSRYLLTTVGQLNFFRWIIENDILDYISDKWKILADVNSS
jgi:hypothetical protein